ncbi:sigma-70 family RNA polymerase sigma factor [Nocardioides sp. LHD-245]|uniref:RNA polymerase sigma factor n=1 Tax=Nocardioides sp. LHD-245 TaxID=3051387 RepID=UPI0027E06F5F|nr:sigma-70 family RNA polymerase sigma factor [Nocardioides sp. LHD-245]
MRDIADLGAAREDDFRRLYAAHFDAVLGFALRRTDRPEDAADVTADTFLVAWRRLAHVPRGDGTRPWLYGVARRTLANHRRGEGRRTALGERLRGQLAHAVADLADEAVHRADVTAAMKRLSARDEEVLQLHLWEGLAPREIAEVLGLPATVVRPRLSRARSRLRALLGNDPPGAGHLPSEPVPSIPKESPR